MADAQLKIVEGRALSAQQKKDLLNRLARIEGQLRGVQKLIALADEPEDCDAVAQQMAAARKALGDALYRRGSYDQATEQYRKAVELRPGLGDDVYLKLGNIAYKQGERASAVELWTRALEMNPENGIARTNLELVQRVLSGQPA